MARDSSRLIARGGFTLVEALISTSIAAIAGSALLLGLSSALETSTEAVEQTVATALAQQLMDEIAGKRYCGAGEDPHAVTFGPSSYEQGGSARERYDDIDDYNGFASKPAKDPWGIRIGRENGIGGQRHTAVRAADYFSQWRQEVEVYYVSSTDLSQRLAAGQTSDHRAVEVRILINDPIQGLRPVTTLRRVFSNVPT